MQPREDILNLCVIYGVCVCVCVCVGLYFMSKKTHHTCGKEHSRSSLEGEAISFNDGHPHSQECKSIEKQKLELRYS